MLSHLNTNAKQLSLIFCDKSAIAIDVCFCLDIKLLLKFKMPKNITSEVREIILKVKEFMDEEKRMQVPIIPLSKVYVRVSAATGK